jgi:hypothetical protein
LDERIDFLPEKVPLRWESISSTVDTFRFDFVFKWGNLMEIEEAIRGKGESRF